MKKEKLLNTLELADEKYVEEANPETARRSLKKKWLTYAGLAACLCLLLTACGLWMFLPYNTNPPDISAYSNSEYYGVIQKLNEVTFSKPRHKNNFDMLSSGIFNIYKDGNAIENGAAPESTGTADTYGQMYQEVTDNQVSGVIEGDRIKRSTRYIYYLAGDTLRVYNVAGTDSMEIGTFLIADYNEMLNAYTDEWEFYLSADCNTVTVIAPYYNTAKKTCVALISLDVTDPANITKKNTVTVSGDCLSSRLVNGKVLLLTQFHVGQNPDFSEEQNFLPQINSGNGTESIPAENIISPETLTNAYYTVVCKLDENTLALEGSAAFLSYSQEVYVSNEHVYATRSYTETAVEGSVNTSKSMTEISCLSYTGEQLEQKGSILLDGYVNDQYSMDEYNGILRVVTTTSVSKYTESILGETTRHQFIADDTTGTNASLYCISLSDWQVAAQVVAFAPPGETVQSVRFDKEAAYVCTSIQLSDPVFFFDLSDIKNITYKDTGTIQGYSSSLVNWGDGYLLGVGVGSSWDSLKIEIYEETETGVSSVCSYELANTTYSTDYKSYYIDRENRFVGLGIISYTDNAYYDSEQGSYLLLFFDNYKLRELAKVPLTGANEHKRAVCIDGYLYLFGANGFKVEQVFQ